MTTHPTAAARTPRPLDELFDTARAADYVGVKPHTLEVWRSSGRHQIPHIRVGKLVRYRRSVLDSWLDKRTVGAEPASGE